MRDFQLLPTLEPLVEALVDAGGKPYLVGGGVRDHLLGADISDWDIEVFALEPKRLERALRTVGEVNTVGRAFGVYKWRPRGSSGASVIDVSVPRRDSKHGPGHRGIRVEGDPFMSVEEAVRRRDLTVNAMMVSLTDGAVIDLCDGRRDLRSRTLRAVDASTFLEDPLRALRVVQFAARLGFAPNSDLIALCQRADLLELPKERVRMEWEKLLLKAPAPSIGLRVAEQTNVLARVFPNAPVTVNDERVDAVAHHARHRTHDLGRQWTLMLAAWLHGCTESAAIETLDRLGMVKVGGTPVRDLTLALLEHHADPASTDAELRHLSTRVELQLALWLRRAEGQPVADALARAESLGILRAAPPRLLEGRHLMRMGVPPGPRIGAIVKAVYDLQLDGSVTTTEDALREARKHLG